MIRGSFDPRRRGRDAFGGWRIMGRSRLAHYGVRFAWLLGAAVWLLLLKYMFDADVALAGSWSWYEAFYRESLVFIVPVVAVGAFLLWRWTRQPRRIHFLFAALSLGVAAGYCGAAAYGTTQRQAEQARIGAALGVNPADLPYSARFPAMYLANKLNDGRHTESDVDAIIPLTRGVLPCGADGQALLFLADEYEAADVVLVRYDEAGRIIRARAVTDNSRGSLEVECRRLNAIEVHVVVRSLGDQFEFTRGEKIS